MVEELFRRQSGVISRSQALSAGVTAAAVRARLRSGRWQAVFPGVYAGFSGPLPRPSLQWAVLLRAGTGAVLSHQTAAELVGLVDAAGRRIHVTIPSTRAVRPIPGAVVHRSRRAVTALHPARNPPQTRVEETIIDLTQVESRLDDAIGWLARGIGARLTTVERLRAAVTERRQMRWREPLLAALTDVDEGCHSLLEVHYVRRVERPHGLPCGERQSPTDLDEGARRYRDIHYREYRTVVELDGRTAHPGHERARDRRRDNSETLAGNHSLRYGYGDVWERQCMLAVEVGSVIGREGWPGSPYPCPRPDCAVRRPPR